MLAVRVAALPDPQTPVEHVSGMHALPRVAETLVTFEPSVLLTSEGRGAIYAPDGHDGPAGDRLWFLVDAAQRDAWEGDVRLSFLSKDERVYLSLVGATRAVTTTGVARSLWRDSFARWFADGPEDPRLLVVMLTAVHAEFYRASSGRVSPPFES
jgi:general stress protein 26